MKKNTLILLFCLVLLSRTAAANTITVNSLGHEVTTNGSCTLREAIHNVNNPGSPADYIDCGEGSGLGNDIIDLSGVTGTINLTTSLEPFNQNVTLIGPGADQLTLRAGGSFRIFDSASAGLHISISGLTLTKGAPASGPGGAVYVEATDTFTLSHVVVTDNQVTDNRGGGIHNKGTLYIDHSTISNNKAVQSAGAPQGGGISNEGTLLRISDSTLSGNACDASGGGILAKADTVIINSTLDDNSGTFGGGILIAAIAPGVDVTVLSSTLTNNHATTSEGGGISMSGGSPSDMTLTIQNSILAGNTAAMDGPDCTNDDGLSGTITSQGYNLVGIDDQCAGEFNATGDLKGTLASPLPAGLLSLLNNGGDTLTRALQGSSLAVDAGNPGGCRDETGALLAQDQRGFPRKADGDSDGSSICDIGSFEITCGDGLLSSNETCDNGSANSDSAPNACRSDCQAAACGDGVVDSGEACDDGNDNDVDNCTNACALPSCGNGQVEADEECDDGNSDNFDDCLNTCLDSTDGSNNGGSSSGGCRLASGKASAFSLLLFGLALGALSATRVGRRTE